MARQGARRAGLIGTLLGVSVGCATILRGTTTTVTIRSDAPGAEVIVDGYPRGVTPLAVPLDHTLAHDVIVRRGGMARAFHLASDVEPGWIVLDLFTGGLIGIVVDAATGAWRALSQEDVVAWFGAASLLAPTLPPPALPPSGPVAPWSGQPSE